MDAWWWAFGGVRPVGAPAAARIAAAIGPSGRRAKMTAMQDVERLDYSKPPPGYTVGLNEDVFWRWSTSAESGPLENFQPEALAAAWVYYKERHDPPGMAVEPVTFGAATYWKFRPEGRPHTGEDRWLFQALARAAAWAWHDRRLALANAVNRDAPYADMWPRSLTFSDENAAVVERWLVDSTAEMPEVLRA